MKNAIIAGVLLIIIIGIVTANAIIVANITDKLTELVESENIEELDTYWQEKYFYLSLSANLKLLEEAEKALSDMKTFKQTETEDEFLAAKQRFINQIDEIAMGEKVIFYNIFCLDS